MFCFAFLMGANSSFLYIHELTQEKEEVSHADERGKGRNKGGWGGGSVPITGLSCVQGKDVPFLSVLSHLSVAQTLA